jgi:hypothetical protein
MITAGAEKRVLVATKPVDFRKQADGLAAIVQAAPRSSRSAYSCSVRRKTIPGISRPGSSWVRAPDQQQHGLQSSGPAWLAQTDAASVSSPARSRGPG